MLLLENVQHRLFITPIINLTKNSICLTYYYYLTENKTVLLSSYYLNQQDGLTTILALSIGKGIPAALGVIGFMIYIIKKIEN
ncbi:unnamed protein product [Rotaria sordida]|uniref:Uncharacterized protein n=1 Tax=Rotaria sordida TaxID=392033 RepID=A0A814IEQ1_9BILA|nr:unnamed protein product [Rotaria sordida]CAF1141205.1 unnamed protein product [Rotaria sordida]